jgi:macrodomain Ter protein organizer (MatP/YcbG family)
MISRIKIEYHGPFEEQPWAISCWVEGDATSSKEALHEGVKNLVGNLESHEKPIRVQIYVYDEPMEGPLKTKPIKEITWPWVTEWNKEKRAGDKMSCDVEYKIVLTFAKLGIREHSTIEINGSLRDWEHWESCMVTVETSKDVAKVLFDRLPLFQGLVQKTTSDKYHTQKITKRFPQWVVDRLNEGKNG